MLNSQNIVPFIPTYMFTKMHGMHVLLLSPQSVSLLKCT
jgi:hypothetical protein